MLHEERQYTDYDKEGSFCVRCHTGGGVELEVIAIGEGIVDRRLEAPANLPGLRRPPVPQP